MLFSLWPSYIFLQRNLFCHLPSKYFPLSLIYALKNGEYKFLFPSLKFILNLFGILSVKGGSKIVTVFRSFLLLMNLLFQVLAYAASFANSQACTQHFREQLYLAFSMVICLHISDNPRCVAGIFLNFFLTITSKDRVHCNNNILWIQCLTIFSVSALTSRFGSLN